MIKPVVLEAQHISRRFSEGALDVSVLQDVNLSVTAGETLAIVGASGSGKSTFLRLVAGELAPDPVDGGRRTYFLDGAANPSAIGVRERLAFVSPEQQERYLNIEWIRTARDVLLTGFHQTDYLYRKLSPEQKLAADKLADELRLGPLLRRDVQTLSQGEFRRVLIARALLGEPRLLLLDEFTDGLDAAMRAELAGTPPMALAIFLRKVLSAWITDVVTAPWLFRPLVYWIFRFGHLRRIRAITRFVTVELDGIELDGVCCLYDVGDRCVHKDTNDRAACGSACVVAVQW